ncbi:unnamed protein product [Arctia plantaginis]|uniref:Chitin-binding type-2 domain-containing protein n=1 Tax=Arctia plantaginis TaxID=874455 RepID=A0A8S1AHG5_ARCPL|nr:unnamed protein product [Arctia plantaginis]CAB3260707.1 unnamed protein product [Arctia plantaginis]
MKCAILSVLLIAALAQGAVLLKENKVPDVCAAQSDNVFIAHEHCNKFYICSGGSAIVFSCSVGTLWNPSLNICDFAASVNCGNRIIPGEDDNVVIPDIPESPDNNIHDDPSLAPQICAAPDSLNALVAHANCNQFYLCLHGFPVPQFCQAGLLFDPREGRCDWPNLVNCGNRNV